MRLTPREQQEQPERPLGVQAPLDAALYGDKSPLLRPDLPQLPMDEAKRLWETVTLPAMLAEGTIVRRPDGTLAYTTAPDTAGVSIAADAPFHAQASKME